jgi:hypothetical protein
MKKLILILTICLSSFMVWGQGAEKVASQNDLRDTSQAYLAGAVEGVALEDSGVYVHGYVTPAKNALKIPYTGATTDVNLGVHNITMTGDIATDSIEANKIQSGYVRGVGTNVGAGSLKTTVYGFNDGTVSGASGVWGYSYTTSGTNDVYGIIGTAEGSASGAVYVGVKGAASGGATNYAGLFSGNVKIDDGGNLLLAGSSSGTATLKAPAAAGTAIITLPAVTGTLTLVLSGGADTTGIAPPVIGAIYVNTSGNKVYISKSTERGGWLILNYFLAFCLIGRWKKE